MQEREGRIARSAPSCVGDLPTAPIELGADPKTQCHGRAHGRSVEDVATWTPLPIAVTICGSVRFGAVDLVAATLLLPLRTSTHYRG